MIQPLHKIRNLPTLLHKDDALFVDLDETLISAEAAATEASAAAFAALLAANDVPYSAAWEAACAVWETAQHGCAVFPAEGDATLDAIRAVRAMGIVAVGLTARSPTVAVETAQQLERAAVDSLLDSTSSIGVLGSTSSADGQPPLTHYRGVVYCSGSRKYDGICCYEAAVPLVSCARRIVLIDDKRHHLEQVARALEGRRDFLGLHYTGGAAAAYTLPRAMELLACSLTDATNRERLRTALACIEAGLGVGQGHRRGGSQRPLGVQTGTAHPKPKRFFRLHRRQEIRTRAAEPPRCSETSSSSPPPPPTPPSKVGSRDAESVFASFTACWPSRGASC